MGLEVKSISLKILTRLVRIDPYHPGLRALDSEAVGPERVDSRNYYKLAVRGHGVLYVVVCLMIKVCKN